MSKPDSRTFDLPLRMLWLGVLPLIVLFVSGVVISRYGLPPDHLARATVSDGHAEAAARLRMLATWLLLAGIGLGCIAYFFVDIRRLSPATVMRLSIAYAIAAIAGIAYVYFGWMQGTQRFVDERIVRAAFAMVAHGCQPGALPAGPNGSCPGRTMFDLLMDANGVQKYLLMLFTPVLVLGTISSLALPRPPTVEACRFQVRRLNTHLYLTATAFVAGLLFLSALLHWPGFAFQGAVAASYRSHVDALILYEGMMFSLFIGSYYIPVALILIAACDEAEARPREAPPKGKGKAAAHDESGTPASELFNLLKAAAALFAPAIAGLLGGIFHF